MDTYTILSRFFGKDYKEASLLDSLLSVFNDDRLHDVHILDERTQGYRDAERVLDKLERDGYLKRNDDYIEITSEGRLFLGKGGYTHDFLETKRGNVSFWISIGSAILAITSFILSLVK